MVVLKELDGFIIKVNPWNGKFYAAAKGDEKGRDLYDGNTLQELEEKIKRHNSNKRRFKPLEVISIGSDKIGRITSRVADSDSQIYFTWKPSPTERASRIQTPLLNYGFGKDKNKPLFAKATVANLAVFNKIKDIESQIKTLRDLQESFRGTYGNLVTWDTIDEQDGGD